MIANFSYDQLWDSVIKLSKFIVWLGIGAGSVGGLGYGFGLMTEETKNNLLGYSIKI